MTRAFLILLCACILALRPGIVTGQNNPTSGGKPQDKKTNGEISKNRPTLDQLKLPPGGVVVVVEEIKEALSYLPKIVLMSPADYQRLLDRLAALEKQVKSDKKTAHVCKLSGRVEGDFVLLRAEFAFTTEQPKTSVLLGLQGAQLTDEGEMDHQIPLLDFGDEGFLVKVEKAGTHQLLLKLKVAVSFKRAPVAGGTGERGFDLGLPGAAVTTLALDLPAGVKEIRWNDTLEKPRGQNHWELALGKVKSLNLAWKEPVTLPGNAPLLSADSQITVKLDDNLVLLNADLILEDRRGQTKEWQLLLPPNPKIEVKPPLGLSFDLLKPEGNRPYYVIRLAEPSTERVSVNIQVHLPRPLVPPRLSIGPFYVMGTYRQEGAITVVAPPEILRGQRLLFYRNGDIYQRDVPKGQAGTGVAALFQFWNASGTGHKNPPNKALLDMELKSEKGPAGASVDHAIQVKPVSGGTGGWLIEVSTSFHLKTEPDFLDVQLPRYQNMPLGTMAIAAGSPFPATLSWLPLAPVAAKTMAAMPLEFLCEDDGSGLKLAPADGQRRARLTWNRSLGSGAKVVVIGKYWVPADSDHVRIELPRPLNVIERGGAKGKVELSEQLELLAAGSEGPAVDKHRAEMSWDTFPDSVDIAWKPFRPELPVVGLTDIWLHERSAEVRHQVQFIVPARTSRGSIPHAGSVRFRIPPSLKEIKIESGGKLIHYDPVKGFAWIQPTAEAGTKADLVLHYDFFYTKKEEQPAASNRVVAVPLAWPDEATQEDVKVRIWSETGPKPFLLEREPGLEGWKDFGIEIVPGSDVLPALVLQRAGRNMPLFLRLIEPANSRLAAIVADRALIQVAIDEEGTHTYRARYLIRKLNARHLDFELPIPVVNCLQSVWLDKHKVTNWEPLEPVPNIAHVPVQPKLYSKPFVLEIEYKLPSSFTEGKRFWRTTLYAPQFRSEGILGRTRWEVSLPYAWEAIVPAGNLEYRWGLQGWLLGPEPSVTSSELDTWLTGREATEPSTPVRLAFSGTMQNQVQLLHLSRQVWLLICSGLLLAVGLALYVLPMARTLFWLVIAVLGLGLAAVGLVWPGWVPALVFGCQPGLLVLVVLLGIQWMLQQSYRRQLVFLPGFTRLKANSSMVRASAAGNRREPSTIDAPVPVPGSNPPKMPS